MDATIWDLLVSVKTAIIAGWPAADADAALPARRLIAEAQPVHDCEQLTVFLSRMFVGQGDPSEEVPARPPAGAQLVAEVQVSIIRCAAPMSAKGDPPSADRIEASAELVMSDAALVPLLLARAQRVGDLAGCQGFGLLSWSPTPPSDFVGGTWTLHLVLD